MHVNTNQMQQFALGFAAGIFSLKFQKPNCFIYYFNLKHVGISQKTSGPAEQGGGGGDRPPNISGILPIFPEI